MNSFIIVFVGVMLVGLVSMAISIYNGLVALKSQLERAWANVDVILKQRFDEIPQLVQVIEQYVGYESSVLQGLAEARSRYGSARTVGEKIQASQELSLTFQGVMSIGEAYPDLKSNANFVQLQNRVSELENTTADRREMYNDTVAQFNARIAQIPDVFAARFLGYLKQDMFEVTAADRLTPSLKMNLPKFSKGA
jgi:LemA protein